MMINCNDIFGAVCIFQPFYMRGSGSWLLLKSCSLKAAINLGRSKGLPLGHLDSAGLDWHWGYKRPQGVFKSVYSPKQLIETELYPVRDRRLSCQNICSILAIGKRLVDIVSDLFI